MTEAADAALTAATRQRLEAIYAEYGRGNRAYALDALAGDVVWISHAGSDLPWAGTWRGRAGVEAYYARVDALLQLTAYEIERIIVEGEYAVALARGTARFHATGEVVTVAKSDMLRVVGGRIVEFREFYDGAPLAACVARCGGAPG